MKKFMAILKTVGSFIFSFLGIVFRFLGKHWVPVLSVLLTSAGLMAYTKAMPVTTVQHIIFWLPVLLSLTLLFPGRSKRYQISLSLSMPFFMLVFAIMYLYPMNLLWLLLPLSLCFLGWILYTQKEFESHILPKCTLLLLLCIGFTLEVNQDDLARQKYLEANPPQTVVLHQIDRKAPYEVYVSIEDHGIYRFDNIVRDAGQFNAGDTVQIVIYNDKITYCQKK